MTKRANGCKTVASSISFIEKFEYTETDTWIAPAAFLKVKFRRVIAF